MLKHESGQMDMLVTCEGVMCAQVKHMVDAVSHVTGATPVAGTTGQAAHTVGRDQLPQDGMAQPDAQANMSSLCYFCMTALCC